MYYLGVDGGGTKTRFVLIDAEGRIAGQALMPTANHTQVQIAGAAKVLAAGIAQVCAAAGVLEDEIAYSFFGLPSFGELPEEVPVLEDMVRKILGNDRFRCGNDVEAGWAGSLACRPGINLVAGTGSIGFGRDPGGGTARTGGWGCFCGDEGSAYWLGKQLISMFGKQADGREARTPLYEIVRRELALKDDFDLIPAVMRDLGGRRDAIAGLARLVYRAAQASDAKALAMYEAAAYEHSLMAKALLRQLHFPAGAEITVSYTGGVFRAGAYVLDPLRRFLAKETVRLQLPLLQPATGAALYAMIQSGRGAPEELVETLRRQEAQVSTS